MLQRILLNIKIFIRLHYSYPRSAKHRRIRSILPATLKIGDGLVIEENVTFSNAVKSVGDYCYIGQNAFIDRCESIGKFCSISRDVKIGLISHPLDHISTSPVFYAPRRGWVSKQTYNELPNGDCSIGHDVLISAGVIVLAGVKIGNGAVIGAGSFVNEDVPPYAIVAGAPARMIRYRFKEEEIAALQQIRWWDMPKEELLEMESSFNNVPDFIKKTQQK